MATWVVGDIQGCYRSFRGLLEACSFTPGRDRLWMVGDLVNRGPDSLSVLRWAVDHDPHITVVLGNHDLHLLGVAQGIRKAKDPGLETVLEAPDREALLNWLASQHLLHRDLDLGYTLVHAGLPPGFDIDQCAAGARLVEELLANDRPGFLASMYGDQPEVWHEDLSLIDRARFAVNHLTRLRMCHPDGRAALDWKGTAEDAPQGLSPWFSLAQRATREERIVFGHWSALGRVSWPEYNCWCLDTGCVWGRTMTAMRLEDRKIVHVRNQETTIPH